MKIKLANDQVELWDLDSLSTSLKVNKETLRRYIRTGRLKAVKIGRRFFVSQDNLRDFANGNTKPKR